MSKQESIYQLPNNIQRNCQKSTHMQDNNNDGLNPWSNYSLIVLKADFATNILANIQFTDSKLSPFRQGEISPS